MRWPQGAWLGLLACLPAAPVPAADPAPPVPPAMLRADLAAFYEASLGRPLAPGELDRLVPEFLGYFDREDCAADCAAMVERLRADTVTLRERAGTPDDLLTRKLFITGNALSPRMQGTLQLELLLEPDPIRIVDRERRRVMTGRDLEGWANLAAFLDADAPRHRRLSAQELDEVTQLVGRAVGADTRAVELPIVLAAAGPLWAGAQRYWPELDTAERAAVRDHVRHGAAKPMPPALYARLLEIQLADAEQIAAQDRFEGELAALRASLARNIKALGDAIVTRSLIQEMQSMFR
jgi:hypothetical protein